MSTARKSKVRVPRPTTYPNRDLTRWAVQSCANVEEITYDDLSVLLVLASYANLQNVVSTWASTIAKYAFGEGLVSYDYVIQCLTNLRDHGLIEELDDVDPKKLRFLLTMGAVQ